MLGLRNALLPCLVRMTRQEPANFVNFVGNIANVRKSIPSGRGKDKSTPKERSGDPLPIRT